MLFTRKFLAAWAVLLLSLAGTLAGWQFAARLTEARAKAQLDAAAERVASETRRRMTAYEQVLHAGAALFTATGNVQRTEWRDFVAHLNVDAHFPGIQGIGFARRLAPAELAAHVRAVRAEGFPDYTVRPEGARETYSSIVYLEPFSGRNLRAFGFDMFSEPVRREAMQRAGDTSDGALSGKVTLVQETEQDLQAGFLLYVPVYNKVSPRNTAEARRAALLGWVYAPFRMNDFMRAFVDRGASIVDVDIFDGKAADEAALLFDMDEARGFRQPPPAFWHRQDVLELAGHRWTLQFRPQPTFAAGLDAMPRLVLAGGAVISLLLFAIAAGLATTRARAMAQAQRLGESEARLRLILDSTGEAIYGIDTRGNCTFANTACLELIGATGESALLGRNMHELIHHHRPDGTPYPNAECHIYQAFREGRGTHVDNEVMFRLDGRPLETEYWSSPILREGTAVGAVVTFIDIGERRRSERQIAEQHAQIMRQNQALAEANRARTEFLRTMRHELRTPLNVIIGFAELLVEGIPQPLPEEQRRYARDILEAGQEQLRLINEILLYATAEAGHLPFRPQPVDPKAFLAERLRAIEGSAGRKDIALALEAADDLPPLVADAQHLRTLFDQLLDNAVKFTPAGGKVTLRATSLPSPLRGGGAGGEGAVYLEISVTDTGPGIAAADQPRLFQPFVQLDPALTRSAGGTGMGLALARRLTELHGGEIRVDSAPGRGSTFSVRLPWQPETT